MDYRNPPPKGGFVFDRSPSLTSQRSPSPENSVSDSGPPTPAKPFHPISGATTAYQSANTSALQLAKERESHKYFRSRRINKDDIQQPWKTVKDPREKWVTIIPLIGIAVGFLISGYLIFNGLKSVVKHQYVLVLDEDFSKGFNTDVWTKESNVGGFGNGEFEQTTTTDENIFIQEGKLHIKPTLQDEKLLTVNQNLTLSDCTGTTFMECNAVTNTTNGTIIPPIKSGRINTKKGATIKYGRIEVTAQLPEGDWLWPAIWMMPVNNTYGPWPRSGEIDIMESRGNNYTYEQGGNNIASSTLHWGPNSAVDAWYQTNVKRKALHTTYAAGENVFGLEWSEKYMFTYINNKLLQIMYVPFIIPLWDRGHFPLSDSNGTAITNPWSTGGDNAPFDQKFYLILNVGIGGTNGWFQDGKSGKPWVDSSKTAAKDFIEAKDQWLPTWKKPEMVISKVQIWEEVPGKPKRR